MRVSIKFGNSLPLKFVRAKNTISITLRILMNKSTGQ